MPNYQPLSVAAGNIEVSEETLLEFFGAGWIKVVSKNGSRFVSRHDQYLAKFILHLRQKLSLTNEQIEIVLTYQKPPYALDQVAAILASHAAAQ